MERDYWLIASFLDADKCKDFIETHPKAFWIGVFPVGSLRTEHGTLGIPMWLKDDFIRDFPHNHEYFPR